jgi:hypothetical protein
LGYKLLDEFRGLFEGKQYNHRNSTLGDHVASFLFEDLHDLGKSTKLVSGISSQSRALNRGNRRIGKSARRGDGTFGEVVPGQPIASVAGLSVSIAEVATIEIGAEVKILAKAMIKQIDRVCTDMLNQISEFKRHGGSPICVGIVGVNWAKAYTSYEGVAVWPTDGKKRKHPIQEAADAEGRLLARVAPHFDEFVFLNFQAGNTPPNYDFSWVDQKKTEKLYGASLVRISREYEKRF